MSKPTLRFSPTAWLKLLYCCHAGDTEVGGFGVTAEHDRLLVEEFHLVPQECTSVTTEFDDDGVANYFEDMNDRGLKPDRYARVWLHTHPGDSPRPSNVDEECVKKAFGKCDQATMFILAKGGDTYARLQLAKIGSFEISVEVDWEAWPKALQATIIQAATWEAEFKKCVRPRVYAYTPATAGEKAADFLKSNQPGSVWRGVENLASRHRMMNTLELQYPRRALEDMAADELEELYEEWTSDRPVGNAEYDDYLADWDHYGRDRGWVDDAFDIAEAGGFQISPPPAAAGPS